MVLFDSGAGMISFIWDPAKEAVNIQKHGVDFSTASKAFYDPNRKIYIDAKHSGEEERYFCISRVDDKILTVRFVCRDKEIRIIGAGYWRRGKSYYEKEKD